MVPDGLLFDPLIREFLSQGQHVIVVGDPKQAIYGWRGGDRAVIDTFSDRFSLATENQTFLTTSFRSSPVVLEAVDQVFQSLPKLLPGPGPDLSPPAVGRSMAGGLPGPSVGRSGQSATRAGADDRDRTHGA